MKLPASLALVVVVVSILTCLLFHYATPDAPCTAKTAAVIVLFWLVLVLTVSFVIKAFRKKEDKP